MAASAVDAGARATGADADVGFAWSGRRRWCRRRSSAASYRVIGNRSENLQHCQWSQSVNRLSCPHARARGWAARCRHRKVRRCHAGIGATAARGGEFNATRNRLGTQRASELLPDRPDKSRKLRRFARAQRFRPPNGFRPQRIGLAAGDDVDVQLRHHVAQRGDVDLVALRHFFERQRGERDPPSARQSGPKKSHTSP